MRCSITTLTEDELEVAATLSKSVEKFARKIEQIAIIKEVGILVVLAGTSHHLLLWDRVLI